MAVHIGRPLKYRTAKDLQKKVDEYFVLNSGSLTITGLTRHIGLASRQSFYEYEKNKLFGDTIKRARLRIEEYYEKLAITLKNPSGCIFIMKNLGWSDQVQVEHSGTIDNIVRFPLKAPVGAPIDSLESKKAPGTI
jgi:hypothetical protein